MIGLPIDELTLIFFFCPVFCAIFAHFMLMYSDCANLLRGCFFSNSEISHLMNIFLSKINHLISEQRAKHEYS